MNIDERIAALTMNLELLSRDVQELRAALAQDADDIRQLARIVQTEHERIQNLAAIVEEHERRLARLEGGR